MKKLLAGSSFDFGGMYILLANQKGGFIFAALYLSDYIYTLPQTQNYEYIM